MRNILLESQTAEAVLFQSSRALDSFRNIHLGERCVIIGNGPSLNRMDLSFLRNEYTFGMNRIFLGFERWNFLPTYYVLVNKLVAEQSSKEIQNIPCQKFITIANLPWFQNSGDFSFLRPVEREVFSTDVTKGIWEGYTVTFVAMQLAYWMGFDDVYLIGVDHYFKSQGQPNARVTSNGTDQDHFDPNYFGKGFVWQLPDLENSERAYRMAKEAFEERGSRIHDATFEGKLTVFPKVDYLSVFGNSQNIRHEKLRKGSTAGLYFPTGEFINGLNTLADDGQVLLQIIEELRSDIPDLSPEKSILAENGLRSIFHGDFEEAVQNFSILSRLAEFSDYPRVLKAISQFLGGHRVSALDELAFSKGLDLNAEKAGRINRMIRMIERVRTTPMVISATDFEDFTYSKKSHLSALPTFGQYQTQTFDNFLNELPTVAYQECLIHHLISEKIPRGSKILCLDQADQNLLFSLANSYEVWVLSNAPAPSSFPPPVRRVEGKIGEFSQQLSDGSFACIFSYAAFPGIEHTTEIYESIRKDINRLLEPGGYAIHCFTSTLLNSGIWGSSLAEYFFQKQVCLNFPIQPIQLTGDADLLVTSPKAYEKYLKPFMGVPYEDGGCRFSYNVFWQKGLSDQQSDPPLVSVIVSSYQAEEFIEECLSDLENQTIARNLEIIIIDANSPQNERQIIEKYQNEYGNIRYFRTPERISVYAAWNLGLHHAHGKYITPFSTNDRLRKSAYETMVKVFEDDPKAMMVYGDTILTDRAHQTFENHTRVGMYQWPEYSFESHLKNNLVGPHPMWRRYVHQEIGYFDEQFQALADQDFFLRIGERFVIRHIPYVTGLYWVNPGRISGTEKMVVPERRIINQKFESRYQQRLKNILRASDSVPGKHHAGRIVSSGLSPNLPGESSELTLKAAANLENSADGQDDYLITAIVSTYNSEKYIRDCLHDLLNQTILEKIEILVIDSGSLQNEAAIVREYQKAHSNIVYIRTGRESLYEAWNRGVGMARGKYITNANTDDAHRADAFEIMVNALERYPDADLAYADYAWTSQPNGYFSSPQITRLIKHPDYTPFSSLFFCSLGCFPVWRKTIFQRLGLFETSYQVIGDYDFFLRFVMAGLKPVQVEQILSLFYQNPEGITKSTSRSQEEIQRLFSKYRTLMPIERLVKPVSTNQEKAEAYNTLGCMAQNVAVPWVDSRLTDVFFSEHCFQRSLLFNPQHVNAKRNLKLIEQTIENEKAIGRGKKDGLASNTSEVNRQSGGTLFFTEVTQAETGYKISGHEVAGLVENNPCIQDPLEYHVDIILPVYGAAYLVERCLRSVLATTPDAARVIVVDDCTPGNEFEIIRSLWHNHPRVVFSQTERNSGFIGATRLGASLGSAPWILFLNSDTEAIAPGWLEKMMTDDASVGVVGAKLLFPPSIPEPWSGKIQHAGIARFAKGAYHPYLGEPADTPETNLQKELNAVTGACFLVRRRVWDELNGWDDAYGRGVFEDVDFCWRVRQKGLRVIYQPDARLYHYEGASRSTGGGHLLYDHYERNWTVFLDKWREQGESDETLFFPEETVRAWDGLRKALAAPGHDRLTISGELLNLPRLAPDLLEVAVQLASELAQMGSHQQAALLYARASEMVPLDVRILFHAAVGFWNAGMPDRARAAYQRLSPLSRSNPDAVQAINQLNTLMGMGSNLENRGKYSPEETFRLLLEAENLLDALKLYEERLDYDLLLLVKKNADASARDGNRDLADGLLDLAAYIEPIVKSRSA